LNFMYIIGITGPSGSGKTSATRALQSLDALAIDCDEVYHEILRSNEQMKSDIVKRFGYVLTGGEIDRKKLREVVFNEPAALSDLNKITHKYVWNEVDHRIRTFNKRGGELVAIDAIALIESSFNEECDIVVGILAPVELRLNRIMKRDGLTRKQAETRVFAQQDDDFYKTNCDYILENNCVNESEFTEKCIKYFNELLGGKKNGK